MAYNGLSKKRSLVITFQNRYELYWLCFLAFVMLRIYLVRLNLDIMIQNVRLCPDNMKHNGWVYEKVCL